MMVSLSRAPLGTVSITDHRRFTQSISYISSNTDLIGFEQIILFGHPELIHLAKKARHFYIDGTWATPPGFMQILIVMIYEEATDMYIPVFFCLLEKKKANTYSVALSLIDAATDGAISPKTITTDFEQALISEIRMKFRAAARDQNVIGCFFHWKQAIRRYMIHIGKLSICY